MLMSIYKYSKNSLNMLMVHLTNHLSYFLPGAKFDSIIDYIPIDFEIVFFFKVKFNQKNRE